MSGRKVMPTPEPARDAVIARVRSANYTRRGIVTLELEPQPVKVIDFYPQPNQQQRRRYGNGS